MLFSNNKKKKTLTDRVRYDHHTPARSASYRATRVSSRAGVCRNARRNTNRKRSDAALSSQIRMSGSPRQDGIEVSNTRQTSHRAGITPLLPASPRFRSLPRKRNSTIVCGPNAQNIGRLLEAWCAAQSSEALKERRDSLEGRIWRVPTARQRGEIVFIPAKRSITYDSMVHDHVDFVYSKAYAHPAVIVHIRPDGVLVCLKMTSEDMLGKWSRHGLITVGSAYRALLYLPIRHTQASTRMFSAAYDVPMLDHEPRTPELRDATYVNTERLFEIEEWNVSTYKRMENGKPTGSQGRHSYEAGTPVETGAFALDVPSLKNLARWLIMTPTLRSCVDQVNGEGRPRASHGPLSSNELHLISQFVRQHDMRSYFNRNRWRSWKASRLEHESVS